LKDFVPAGRVFLFGAGNLVHVKHYTSYVEASEVQRIYEFTVTDNERGQIIVHRWNANKVQVNVQGYDFQNNWEEIYRTGRLVKDIAFVSYLKELYGDGKPKQLEMSRDRLGYRDSK
jgi:hypothetical protein